MLDETISQCLQTHAKIINDNDPNSIKPLYLIIRYDENEYHYCIHNYLLDSGAIINVMLKRVANVLGLTCISDFSFVSIMDSRDVQNIIVIKDIPIYLDKFTSKRIPMDLVIVYVKPFFSILPSIYSSSILGGTI